MHHNASKLQKYSGPQFLSISGGTLRIIIIIIIIILIQMCTKRLANMGAKFLQNKLSGF